MNSLKEIISNIQNEYIKSKKMEYELQNLRSKYLLTNEQEIDKLKEAEAIQSLFPLIPVLIYISFEFHNYLSKSSEITALIPINMKKTPTNTNTNNFKYISEASPKLKRAFSKLQHSIIRGILLVPILYIGSKYFTTLIYWRIIGDLVRNKRREARILLQCERRGILGEVKEIEEGLNTGIKYVDKLTERELLLTQIEIEGFRRRIWRLRSAFKRLYNNSSSS